jgi:hypothetical protein
MRIATVLVIAHFAVATPAVASDEFYAGKAQQDLYSPYYSGTCIGKSEDVYLNEALFVQNPIVKIRTESGFELLRFIRVELEVRRFDSNGKLLDSYKINLRNEVLNLNRKLKNVDIDLSFIWIQNELGVYWRETYQQRPYLQGVFRIAGKSLVSLCQGSGGFETNE